MVTVSTAGGMAPAPPVERLSTDDDLFVRMEHALGLGVVNQVLWWLDGRLDGAAFTALAAGLRQGRLSRLVRRRPPPCRDRWSYTPTAGLAVFETESITAGGESTWARQQVDAPVNSVDGPAWRLSAAYSEDGTHTLVSLVVAHAVADGWAVVTAVEEAITQIAFPVGSGRRLVLSDIADGASTLLTAVGAAGAMALGGMRPSAQSAAPPTTQRPATVADDADTAAVSTFAMIDAEKFRRVAAERNGTTNSLFVAIMVGVLVRAGLAAPGDCVPISLPVSVHSPGDRLANATTGTTALITVTDDRFRNLSAIRAACKAAYSTVGAGAGAVSRTMLVAQALGDGLVRRLAAGMSTPLCVASNLGDVSADFTSLGTDLGATILMRAVPQRASGVLASNSGGISGWLCSSGDVTTMATTALDPARIPDEHTLRTVVAAELGDWSLSEVGW